MKCLLLFFIFFTSVPGIYTSVPEKQKLHLQTQEILIDEVREFKSDQDLEILKQKVREVCRYSIILNNSKSTAGFLNKLLSRRKYTSLHYFFHLQLARLSRKDKSKHLIKALENSRNDGARLESLIKLYEYHKERGNIKREIHYLEKQVEIIKKTGDVRSLKQLYINLGDYNFHENNLMKSLHNFFEAIKYSEQLENPNNGYIFNRIAKVFSLLGRKKLALKYLGDSLKCEDKQKSNHLRMWVYNIYTELHISEGEYKKAGYYNELSVDIGEETNFPELKLYAFYLRSQIFFHNGDEFSGLTSLKTAVDLGIRSESFVNLLPVLYEFIRKAIYYRNYDIVRSYLMQFDDIYAPFYKGYFFYYFLRGLYYEKRGDLKNAGIFYKRTFDSLEYFFSELNHQRHYPFRKEITFIYSRMAEYNFKMFDKTNNINFLRMALYAGEMKNPYMFRQIADKNRRIRNLINEKGRIEGQISEAGEKLSSGTFSGINKAFHRNRIDSLKTELIELEDLILEFQRRYKRFRLSDLSIRRIQKSLKKDTVIIRFIMLEQNSYAFVLDRGSAGYKKLEQGSDEIKALITSLLMPIERHARGDVDFLRIKYDLRTAKKLFRTLLYDLLEFQKNKTRLIIIPDEELFRLPFEALVISSEPPPRQQGAIFSEYENAGFLIDSYSIEYLLSLFHLHTRKRTPGKKYDLTAFGFPVINNKSLWLDGISEIGQLPSTGEEIKKIKDIWGGRRSRFYTGKEFTKENFDRAAPGSNIIHMATHFISNKKYPWYSLFLFSSGNNNNPLYYVSEISKLKLNCDLIFLSTCNSSENHLKGKQIISGMTATLYNSGAGSMIASLWPVNEFNSRLIAPFYTALKKERGSIKNLASLLRKVKISFRKRRIKLGNGREISFSHPLIWSNFNLYKFFK